MSSASVLTSLPAGDCLSTNPWRQLHSAYSPLQLTHSKSKSHYNRRPVCQSVLVSRPIWVSWPDINLCLTFTVLSMSGAPSDQRSGLSSVLVTWTAQFSNFAAGLCQLLYLGLPLVCLLQIEEAQALPPRQGSNPWWGANPFKQASSSLLLAFASMVILGVELHRDPWPYFCSHIYLLRNQAMGLLFGKRRGWSFQCCWPLPATLSRTPFGLLSSHRRGRSPPITSVWALLM
jgi:hypothetical protein